ncbi:hypothetical protein V9T40_004350 [Parthenolecanium corni]|uniref:Uncharacterized protein n=1 Tax=Parthenolecanium corni TaxID=536013 RepID=A0AAN9TUS2_9HEMI
MLQDEELDVSPGNSGTEHENLSIVDIQRLIKQEKCEAEELPSDDDLHKITEEQLAKKSVVSSSKSKKSINVKRARLQKPSKVVKKKIMPPATQYERMSNRELLAEVNGNFSFIF